MSNELFAYPLPLNPFTLYPIRFTFYGRYDALPPSDALRFFNALLLPEYALHGLKLTIDYFKDYI